MEEKAPAEGTVPHTEEQIILWQEINVENVLTSGNALQAFLLLYLLKTGLNGSIYDCLIIFLGV